MNDNKITKVEQWFDENIVQDQDEILKFGMFASLALKNKFCVDIKPKTVIALYVNTANAFFEILKGKQKNYKSYNIGIDGYFNIGFSNSEDSDEEKSGNFCPYYISEQNIVLNEPEGSGESTETLCIKWSANHITADTDAISSVAASAMQKLKDLKIFVGNSADTLIPIFCVIHAALCGFIRMRKAELNQDILQYSFSDTLDVICTIGEDGKDVVIFTPTMTKLGIKDDFKANRQMESDDE